MTALISFIACLVLATGPASSILNLSKGWSFSLNGEAPETVDLPHDWAFENGFTPLGAQGEQGGFASGGYGRYTRELFLKRSDLKDRTLYLDFDGVYMNSTVSVNGKAAGFRAYGYISYSYDITSLLHEGRNTIEVTVDNTREPSTRWYHGCGIYGGVRLRSENPLHFIEDGLFVRTQNTDGSVDVSFETSGEFSRVEATISDGSAILSRTTSTDRSFRMEITDPKLWSPSDPFLYGFSIRLYGKDGRCTDVKDLRIGFKEVRWDAGEGLFLNGAQYKIHGVCEHLEGGPVGAAWTEDMIRWKLGLLKEMGCNSVRTAHNPQLPVFYDICDEIGLLVMDEVFDGWKRKAPRDYGEQAFAECWQKDLTDFIRRDRNHACVYVYSMGNETKGDVAPSMVDICHDLDPSRAVTSGAASSEYMDVLGVNGGSEKQRFINGYKTDGRAFIGTETPHTWQVRGYYRTMTWYRDGFPNKGQDPFVIPSLTEKEIFGYDWTSPEKRANAKQVFNSSYDNATVRITARQNIAVQRDNDWYSGYYRWTGFDYLGEAGYVHGGWPFIAFQGGVLDMAGFRKDHYYLYQSEWNKDIDMVHLLPSWTHPDMEEGTLIPVWAYTTGDEVELFQDGKSLGKVRKGTEWDRIQCSWMVPWKPGRIEAVAYRNGQEIARETKETAGEPSGFSVTTKKTGDISEITFCATDSKGIPCPYADSRVCLALPEGQRIISFANGSPIDGETMAGAGSRRLFFGLARAFVKGDAEGLVAGMICCDRSMKTSDKAYIDVKGLKDFRILYSTDGSDPSKAYEGPFRIEPGMVIKATVLKGSKAVLYMEEKIEGGLYWGKPGEPAFRSKPVRYKEDGSIAWYQENDGGERDAAIRITYISKEDAVVLVTNNGKKVGEFMLPASPATLKSVSGMMTLLQGANELTLKVISGKRPDIQGIDVL